MLRATVIVVLTCSGSASARPPFPRALDLRATCERALVEATPFTQELTTCMIDARLLRAGPATLVLELAGVDVSERVEGGTFSVDSQLAATTVGLDVNLGRERGDFGLELLWRMSIMWAGGGGGARAEPFPFTYGGLKLGVGWRWLELGGSPYPRPGDPRIVHLGYGVDAHHWIGTFGIGLFGATVFDPDTGQLEQRPATFGSYGEIVGRIGDFSLGVRAMLGGWQALQLIVGWHAELL